MKYYNELIEAIKRTEAWGFEPGDISLDKKRQYLNDQSHQELIQLFDWNYNGLSDDSRIDCTNVSVNMLELVSNHFSTDAYLTTGNVSTKEEGFFFECNLDYLKEVAATNVFRPKLKVHMWITLSSGEIIDFTFFRSMAKKFARWELMKSQIVTSHTAPDLQLIYSPMIIGDDFYRKTGNMVDVKLK